MATHHLLREIRVNHQNIKEADIYLECTCVCVCVCVRVFSVYLIIVFSTFHPWLLPLPSSLSHSDRYSTKTAYLWCILSRLCLQVLDWRRRGEMEGAEREEARKGGTKKHMREREGVATPLLLSEWSVETGLKCGGVTTDWMLIACKDRKRTDMLKWCSWKEHRRTGGSRKKKHQHRRRASCHSG